MANPKRSIAFWFLVIFLALSIVLMLTGQTMAVFNYDLTVRLGLQESVDEVGPLGVQVNRAFGAGDTIVYLPLMIVSLAGLWLRKRWSLLTTAAVAGVSAYWSVTILCIFLFSPGVPGYTYAPPFEIWLFLVVYAAFGFWCLLYLLARGDALLR